MIIVAQGQLIANLKNLKITNRTINLDLNDKDSINSASECSRFKGY